MLKRLVALSVVLCLASSAWARDLARVAPVDQWSGPYLGFVAGVADGHSTANSVVACPAGGFLCDPINWPQNGALLSATASGKTSGAGFTGGILAGYNWRLGNFVYGVESDVSYLHLSLSKGGSASSLNAGLNNGGVPVVATLGATAGIDWLATFRGRIGYLASPDLLLFATGGLAATNLSVSNVYTDNWTSNGGGVGGSSAASTAAGYVAGGGAEWNLGRSWTVRAEYLRVGFRSQTTSGMIYVVQVPAARNPFTSSVDLTADLFRSGLTYKF